MSAQRFDDLHCMAGHVAIADFQRGGGADAFRAERGAREIGRHAALRDLTVALATLSAARLAWRPISLAPLSSEPTGQHTGVACHWSP